MTFFFQVRYSHISSSGLSSHVPGTLLSALYIYSYNLLNNYEMGIMPIPHFIVWKTEGGRKGCVESHMVKLHSQELNPTAWLLAQIVNHQTGSLESAGMCLLLRHKLERYYSENHLPCVHQQHQTGISTRSQHTHTQLKVLNEIHPNLKETS